MQTKATGNAAAQAMMAGKARGSATQKMAPSAQTGRKGLSLGAVPPTQNTAAVQQDDDKGEGPVRQVLESVFGYEEDSVRSQLDQPDPTYDEVSSEGSGWEPTPHWMVGSHDDGQGQPEEKWLSGDGQEVIYDGDTHEALTDPEHAGTYNFVNPVAPSWDLLWDPAAQTEFATHNAGHFIFDMLPYYGPQAEDWMQDNASKLS